MDRTVPIDRTKKEHVATVAQISYHEPESGFTVAKLTDGLVARGCVEYEKLEEGNAYRFLGRWQDHPRWGMQFHFDAFVSHITHSRSGVVSYLTRNASRVGPKTAERLWDLYGADAVRILREQPEQIVEAGIMTEPEALQASDDLEAIAHLEATTIDLYAILSGRGFPGKLTEKAIAAWGVKAPTIIRRDPYSMLIRRLPGAGYVRCDKLYRDLGLNPARLKRQALAAWNEVRTDGDGHTWFRATEIGARIMEVIGRGSQPKRALQLALRAGLLRKHKDDDGLTWVADAIRAISEQSIADQIKRLINHPYNLWPTVRSDQLTPHQREKVAEALREPVGILAGSPGTGKTYSLARILQQVIADHGHDAVCVCAPTGKAAVRATQSLRTNGLDLVAKTIHSTLKIGRNGHDGEGWGFEHNANNPLPFTFIIVDEVSMMDTGIMADLLEACPVGAHVLLIGDPYQLPPVGHGAPLRDMIDAGVPCGELTEVRRNAGMIVHGCFRIKNGESFDTTPKYEPPEGNLRLIRTSSPAESIDSLERLLSGMQKFNPVWQTQVIVATNKKSDLSRTAVNTRLHGLLNPNGHAAKGNPFRVGDKIICLRNSRMQVIGPRRDDMPAPWAWDARNYIPTGEEEIYVANGEIGKVEAVSEGLAIARFSESDHLVRIPVGKKNGDEPGAASNFDLAYAITGHKSQGSEAPCVIVLIDPAAGPIANREWVYTAISRAKDLCILIGDKAVIDKQAARRGLIRRKTFLKELLVEALSPAQAAEELDV